MTTTKAHLITLASGVSLGLSPDPDDSFMTPHIPRTIDCISTLLEQHHRSKTLPRPLVQLKFVANDL